MLSSRAEPVTTAHRLSFRFPLTVALLPAAILLTVVFVYPLGRLIAGALVVDGNLSLARYGDLLETPVFSTVFWRTLQGSASVTALCLLLGYPLAYMLNRLPPRLAGVLLVMVLVPFFSSVLIRSYAWAVILADNGLVNSALIKTGITTKPIQLVYNTIGSYVGMVQIMLPLMILPIFSVMRRVDRSLVLAAQSLGASPVGAFWHVFRPLAMPGVAAGSSLVFLLSLGFFVTPALLGGPGEYWLAQLITVRVFNLGDFAEAAAQASVLLLVVLAIMLVFRRALGLSPESSAELPHRPPAVHSRFRSLLRGALWRLGHDGRALAPTGVKTAAANTVQKLDSVVVRLRIPLLTLICIITLLYLIAPQFVIVLLAFSNADFLTFPPPGYSVRWFESYLTDHAFLASTWLSVVLAGVSAALATVMGAMAAFPLVRARGRALTMIHLLFMSPLIVPQIVFAVAYFFVVAPLDLIGNPIGFVAPYAVLGLPYAVVVMTAVLQRFDRSLEYAAASLGASPVRVFWFVVFPLLRPAILASFVFAFLVAFDDVIIALFLSSADTVTLSVRMWQDIVYELTPKIAAISVCLLAVTIFAVLVAPFRRATWTPR